MNAFLNLGPRFQKSSPKIEALGDLQRPDARGIQVPGCIAGFTQEKYKLMLENRIWGQPPDALAEGEDCVR